MGTASSTALPPTISGRALALLDPAERPAPPAQWQAGAGPVPFATWWSSAVSGPAFQTFWADPLAVRAAADGDIEVSAPQTVVASDGTSERIFEPTVVLQADGATTIRDAGAFHVALDQETPTGAVTLTIVQGSPFLEIGASNEVVLFVPGLALVSADRASAVFETANGAWVIGSDVPFALETDGDHLIVRVSEGSHLAIGPVYGLADDWRQVAREVAASPLLGTSESVEVSPDGSVTQRLAVERAGNGTGIVVLGDHHLDRVVGPEATESLAGPNGGAVIARSDELTVVYPSVPIAWDFFDLDCIDCADLPLDQVDEPRLGGGSYFAGKEALRLAQIGQIAADTGAQDRAANAFTQLRALLVDLVSAGGSLDLHWDPDWGQWCWTPAEFGLGNELNDHSLQYGYWIAAASVYEERFPHDVVGLTDAIDLLVVDMGGATLLDGLATSTTAARTWSAFEGHSWASGLAPFSAGNNLESISESTTAWWATGALVDRNGPIRCGSYRNRSIHDRNGRGERPLAAHGGKRRRAPVEWRRVGWQGRSQHVVRRSRRGCPGYPIASTNTSIVGSLWLDRSRRGCRASVGLVRRQRWLHLAVAEPARQ
ncbi:MAG: glycosyl hydrolase [Acidimicrobiales bacterium]